MPVSGPSNGFPETPILPKPSLVWRATSAATIFEVGLLCRAFLYGLNNTKVNGLDGFLGILKARADPTTRTRGLLTGMWYISYFKPGNRRLTRPLSIQPSLSVRKLLCSR